jgi:hypothetical protein
MAVGGSTKQLVLRGIVRRMRRRRGEGRGWKRGKREIPQWGGMI